MAILAAGTIELGRQAVRIVRRLRHPRAGGEALAIGGQHTIGAAYDALDVHLRTHGPSLRLH